MSQAGGAIADAYAEDLKLERELLERVLAIRETMVRRSILIDLDEFLSPADEFDAGLLDASLRNVATDNALVSEIRSGRMTIDEAKRLLGDHAQSSRLSAELRLSIENRITSRFVLMQEVAQQREEVLNALSARVDAVSRLSEEIKQSAEALQPVFDGAVSPLYPMRAVNMREVLTTAAQLIDDRAVREALQQTIDDLYREEMK